MRFLTSTVGSVAFAAALAMSDNLWAASSSQGRPHGQAANRWRYEFYRGRWWYWKPDAQWSFYDGRRWVDWGMPVGRELSPDRGLARGESPGGSRSTSLYRGGGVYPFNYSTTPAANAGSTTPGGGMGAVGPVPRSGFGTPTISGGNVGVGLETGSRSGDASSGVGGGTVGGADVSGFGRPR